MLQNRIRVRFRAAGQLEQRAVGFVQADPGGLDALVVVDTSRATPEDMEGSLLALRRYLDLGRSDVRIPIYKNDLGAAARERANGSSKSLLHALHSVKGASTLSRAPREVITEVDLPSIVVRGKH